MSIDFHCIICKINVWLNPSSTRVLFQELATTVAIGAGCEVERLADEKARPALGWATQTQTLQCLMFQTMLESLWKGCIFWKLWYMDDGLLPKINRKGFSSNAASKSKPIHQRPKALPLSELLGLPPHVWSWSTQLNVKFCRTCACTPKRSNGPSPKQRIEIAHWTSYERFLEGLCPFDGRLKQHFPILKTAGP